MPQLNSSYDDLENCFICPKCQMPMDISSFNYDIVVVCPDCGFESDEFLYHSAVNIDLGCGRDNEKH